MTLFGILLGFITAFCWAVAPLLYKRGLDEMDRQEANFVRSIGFVGAMSLFAFFFFQDALHFPSALQFWLLLAAVVLGNILGDGIYFASILNAGVNMAVSVTSAYPLVVTFVSYFALGENVTFWVVTGTLMILAGLYLLRRDNLLKEDPSPRPALGFLQAIIAAILWGIAIPISRWLLLHTDFNALSLTFWRSILFMASSFVVVAYRSISGQKSLKHLLDIPLRAHAYLVAAGAISLAFGGIAFMLALEFTPASIVTPITATSPFVTVLFAVLWLREPASATQWVGIVLIVLGSIVMGF